MTYAYKKYTKPLHINNFINGTKISGTWAITFIVDKNSPVYNPYIANHTAVNLVIAINNCKVLIL